MYFLTYFWPYFTLAPPPRNLLLTNTWPILMLSGFGPLGRLWLLKTIAKTALPGCPPIRDSQSFYSLGLSNDLPATPQLGGRFDFFLFFFCSGEGKGESGATGRGGGVRFLLKMPGEGGMVSQEEGGGEGAGRVSAGNLGGGGGRRVKQVQCGKLAFLLQNGAFFGPKNDHFRPFRTTF